MNKQEKDVLLSLAAEPYVNQRVLSERCGCSLGMINRSLRSLMDAGFVDDGIRLTRKAAEEMTAHRPKNAIILAAGFGMRMVPINLNTPKGLLEVHGERLIDRLIRQLHEVNIRDITVVVGYMKDAFEYLIDEFGVQLIYNEEYATRNNIKSLDLAVRLISNTYILPADLWCEKNPFAERELYSWYMVSDQPDAESEVRINRKGELVHTDAGETGSRMIGIAYLTGPEAGLLRERISLLCADPKNDDAFWEKALFEDGRMTVCARIAPGDEIVEINTYEQLRELDADSNHLQSDALDVICGVFGCRHEEITGIQVLKKGMTNRSFLFSVRGEKFIMRIPGEGTDQLIDRHHEAKVYQTIAGHGLCDDVVYINPENGFKITKYLEGIRVADPDSVPDLKRCMDKLREFHEMKLTVDHSFDIFGQIEFYESLWKGAPSVYRDYEKTKEQVLSLKSYIDWHVQERVLTHIDAVPDNFLFCKGADGEEELQLTDWEYSGMQDPHVDLAMFSIYSLYDKWQIDRLIDLYFEGDCPKETRIKIYCYVAACGLLWSNWCEYKRSLGVEFGEYSLRQYRFAKDYYRYATEEMKDVVSSK
ncbi:MAG: NTP transferase domain-containing protein [Lachnospiraceae bacterium]|nr:NTP transferase domain-containing protein [Lachnospiraceae bacterium]